MGIDPGTTTGLAVFDLEGNFLGVGSRRNFSRAEIRKFILEQGRPVIIASDVNPLPRSIRKIASSLDSRVVFPETSLTHKDKRRIALDFLKTWGQESPWRNQHEKDALVAGWHAWKRVRPTMRKIERRLGPRDREARDFVKSSLLREGGNARERLGQYLRERNSAT